MPDDVHAVARRRVHREAAPAAADVEHAHARLQPELGADQLELGLLRLLERRRAAREDRARVGHRLAEEQLEERVRDVVVVADRAAVARDAVAAAARAQLRVGHVRHRAQRPGAHGRGGDPRPRRARRSAAGSSASSSASAPSTSSTSSAPETYARPTPSWPGERSTWPSACGERSENVGPPFVDASARAVPQLDAERPARAARPAGRRAAARCSRHGALRLPLRADANDVPGEARASPARG